MQNKNGKIIFKCKNNSSRILYGTSIFSQIEFLYSWTLKLSSFNVIIGARLGSDNTVLAKFTVKIREYENIILSHASKWWEIEYSN